jgi:glycosyltransferase involved in cell wall biosynthesis
MKRSIEQLSSNGNFDVVHIEHVRAGYMLPPNRTIPAVYDSVDCITSLYQRFRKEESSGPRKVLAIIESKKLAQSEPDLMSKYDAVIATTRVDKESLETLSRSNKQEVPNIYVIANGVDSDYFKPLDISPEPYSIVFTGKMRYYANELAAIHLAREIFPIVKAKIPRARLYIVGARPSKNIQQLEEYDGVTVTGWVPDLRQYLSLAHVVVCPVRVAVGIQNKLLEAMSMAKGIVAYTSPAEPLEPKKTDLFMLAHDPENFADSTVALMRNDSLRVRLGTNARLFVQHHYSWNQKVAELETLYYKVIEKYNHG